MNSAPKKLSLQLHIEKRSIQEWMALLVFVLPFTFGLLIEFLRIPDTISFVLEFTLLCLCIFCVRNRYIRINKSIRPLVYIVVGYVLYTLIAYIFNFQSPFYYIWGCRSTFSYYIAFFAFIAYISEDDAKKCLKFLDIVFWINFAVSLIQFYAFGVRQDYLGGIFGASGSTNAYTLAFLCIVVSKTLLSTFNGDEKNLSCVLKCVASLVLAAMAEMKFFYFAFIIILILSSVLTKFSVRKLWLIILSAICIAIGSLFLTTLFGFEGFLSWENLIEYATKENYSSTRDLNRFSAIFTLSRTVLTEPYQRLFGMGLGNCDTSTVEIFHSTFHQSHSYLHYEWFSSVMVFLETGIVGLMIFLSFFVTVFVFALIQFKKNNTNKLFCQLAMILSVLSIIISFYNSAHRIYSAYMIYFILALPYIAEKSAKNASDKNE